MVGVTDKSEAAMDRAVFPDTCDLEVNVRRFQVTGLKRRQYLPEGLS